VFNLQQTRGVETDKWVTWTTSDTKDNPFSNTTLSAVRVSEQTNPSSAEPQSGAYPIPTNPAERQDMIVNMVKGSLTRDEAAQSIALRRTALNRAVKEFKQSANKRQNKKSKTNLNSGKPVNESYLDFVNKDIHAQPMLRLLQQENIS
jgi:hypothetical protein